MPSPTGQDGASVKGTDKEILVDVLRVMYQEHQTNARHHETQRSTVNNFIILVAGAMVSLTFTGGLTEEDLPLSISLIALGTLCAVFNLLLFGRYHRHKRRAYAYRDEIDRVLFPGDTAAADTKGPRTLRQIKKEADSQPIMRSEALKSKSRILRALASVHWLWLMLPLIVVGLGAILTYYCWGVKESSNKPVRVIIENSNVTR